MTLPIAVNGGPVSAMSLEDQAIDFSSPLDVPAFLRRQN